MDSDRRNNHREKSIGVALPPHFLPATLAVTGLFVLIFAGNGLSQPTSQESATPVRSVTASEYGQYYGFGPVPGQVGAAVLQPHSKYFLSMSPDAIKAPHGHFQHVAPADPGDDFPYTELKRLEQQAVSAGQPPIFVTATYGGKKRPVYFSWHLALDSRGHPTADPALWSQAVNIRDERYIRFFAESYVHRQLWRPALRNYWVAVDNCSFRIENYGVLDDANVFHTVNHWDPPFAQNDSEFLDSIKVFLKRLKEVAADIHIMGNEGSMSDERRFADVWGGFDGTIREDITAGFGADAYSRDEVFKFYNRYKWEASARKVALLRALLPPTNSPEFAARLRTAYIAYLVFRGPNFFFCPRFDQSDSLGVPPELYSTMSSQLGPPVSAAVDEPIGNSRHPGFRLYSRTLRGGLVYLNWSGKSITVQLPREKTWFDREGRRIISLTIPDLCGEYVIMSPS